MRGKIFTRREADRMVPLIRRIVLNVRACERLAARKRRELAAVAGEVDARTALTQDLVHLADELERHAYELEGLGCILRDRNLGVTEVFGELEGEIVYFTWRPGQAVFGLWHSLDTSPNCAVPMPELEHSGAAGR